MRAMVGGLSVLFVTLLGSGVVYAQASVRVSTSSDGREALGEHVAPAISADGRYLVFVSDANDLVPNDGNDDDDLFIHDRLTGVTSRLMVGPGGAEVDCECDAPSISGDGRF